MSALEVIANAFNLASLRLAGRTNIHTFTERWQRSDRFVTILHVAAKLGLADHLADGLPMISLPRSARILTRMRLPGASRWGCLQLLAAKAQACADLPSSITTRRDWITATRR